MNEYEKIETLADFKRAFKAFARGVIKSKLFTDDNGAQTKLNVSTNPDFNLVVIKAHKASYNMSIACEVTTRTFNKINAEMLLNCVEQFNKIKGFGGFDVIIAD